MTSAQAAHRLLRHCSVTDPAALSIAQANELMGALSVAVALFFRYGPKVLSQTSASVTLQAPTTVSGLSVAAGAYEVTTGSPFTTAQRGASLLIDGDDNRNEIVSTLGWLNPYQGTTGTKSATIYGDSVPISTRLIENILSDPWILEGSNTSEHRRLVRVRDEHDGVNILRGTTGTPEYYAIQPAGAARGATTQYLIRVWPIPQRQLVLRFECQVSPDLFDGTNVAQTVLTLPFSEVQMETVVLPLAEAELLASTLMDEVKDNIRAAIEARAARAMETLKQLPRDHGKPAGRVRTRRGF